MKLRMDNMKPTAQKRTEDRQKSIKAIELLIAADKGEYETVKRLIQEKADCNYADKEGNTALHCAVQGGNLEVVNLLLQEVDDAAIENNENETPFDIACRLRNENIVEVLGKKIISTSSKLLQEAAANAEASDTTSAQIDVSLTAVDREIKNAEDKIKYCLESLKNLNKAKSISEDLSYEQANVFIYFVEAFALEGSGNEEVKNKVKKYFSSYYSDEDRRIISDVRVLLLKKSEKPARNLRLQDVRKFIKNNVTSFFDKLENYVHHAYDKSSSNTSEIELCSFLNVLNGKDRNIGEEINDSRSFLKREFEKLIRAAYGRKKITPEELFSFTMNFYPAFKRETNSDFKELSDLRNKLIHQFHKYGYVEFGNEIYSLKSRLFKYYYAQEVLKVFNAVEPDENPETIAGNLEKQLKLFNEHFKRDYGMSPVVSQEEAKGSLGYEFSQSVFPERDGSVEELVNQYLKFMVIVDSEKGEDYGLSDIDNEGAQYFPQCKELSDADRREIFEKFDRLKKIRNYCTKGYDEERKKLRDELVNVFGINGYHFDKVCRLYIENDNEFAHKDKSAVEEISKTINNLKKLKDNYKISNQVVISLCDQFVEKQGIFDPNENQSLLKDIDQRIQQEIKNELPRDKTLNISIADKTFTIRTGKVINNMLKTFYNAYHKYQVAFNIEEIFNDQTFLNYVVKRETKEKDIGELAEQYFKFMAFIESGESKEDHSVKTFRRVDRTEMFKKFNQLKKSRKHLCDQDYNEEKQKFKTELMDKNILINGCHFDSVCQLYIENDNELEEKEVKQVHKIENIISNLKSLGFSKPHILSLYGKLLERKGKIDLEEDLSVLGYADNSRKKKVKNELGKLYAHNELSESKVTIQIEGETLTVCTGNIVYNMIESFKEERQLKNPFFTYMIVRKLLRIQYTAPYIVRLITEVKSDDIIEKDDLIKLIEILLKKEEGLYVHHLHSLLDIGSGKVSLYEEMCNTMVKQDVNIENMRIILEEPRHLKAILRTLNLKLDNPSKEERRSVGDLMNGILGLLNNIAYDLYRDNRHNSALAVLDTARTVQEKIIRDDLMENTDLNILLARCHVARIKNQLAKKQRNVDNKIKFHLEALQAFYSIKDTFRYQDSSNGLREMRDIKVHEYPQFLLVLAEVAYTKHLLKEYEESYKEHEILYEEVIKFVLDLPSEISLPDNFLNEERYSDIEKSKKYQKLLAFSDESKKYLDILNIKCGAAFSKVAQGKKEVSEKKFDKALKNFEDALKIYKEVYNYRKKSLGLVYKTIIPVAHHVAFGHIQIGYVLLTKNYERVENQLQHYQTALQYHYIATLNYNKACETLKEMFWPNHPAVVGTRIKIVYSLWNIGFAYNRICHKAAKSERRLKHRKALEIYEMTHDRVFQLEGPNHFRTLDGKRHIAQTLEFLEMLTEAKKMYEDVYDIQIQQFGEQHENTKKTKICIDKINRKINCRTFSLRF